MFNFNLNGLAEWFKLGKQGPIIKKDGDKISFNNSDDSALINVQALDPVDPQDVITKQYMEDNSSLVPFSTSLSLFSNVLYTDASKQIGIVDMPQYGLAYAIQIKVNSTFDGTNPTVTVGTSSDTDRLMELDKNDLTEGNLFYLTLSDIFANADAIKAFVAPDSSTQGDLDITVLYTMSEEADISPSPSTYINSVDTTGNGYFFRDYDGNNIVDHSIIPSSATLNIWFKSNGNGYLLFNNGANGEKVYLSSGQIRFLSVFVGSGLADGNWHLLTVPMYKNGSNFEVYRLFIDSVEHNIATQIITSIKEFGIQGSYGTPVERIAHADIFIGSVFNQTEATEIYNNGVVLNPTQHSRSADLYASYTFGDHPSDNTAIGTLGRVGIVAENAPTDQSKFLVVLDLFSIPTISPITGLIVEDHPA